MSFTMDRDYYFDVVIIGSGFGGGPIAYSLSQKGYKVLVIEQGGYLHDNSRHSLEHIQSQDKWYSQKKIVRAPYSYHCVGGMSKLFSGNLTRMREKDFHEVRHEFGISPAWPIDYCDLENYYFKAEQLFKVQGMQEGDVCQPYRLTDFPYRSVPPSKNMTQLITEIKNKGFSTFQQAVCFNSDGKTVNCDGCLGRCCPSRCKNDVEYSCIEPMITNFQGNIWINAKAIQMVTNSNGSLIEYVKVNKLNESCRVFAKQFVVSCGAIHSSILLLASKNAMHPNGLGNSSGLIGRNYMQHIITHLVAISKKKLDLGGFLKTFSINDYYAGTNDYPYPMGNIQAFGKITADTFKSSATASRFPWLHLVPSSLLTYLLEHAFVISITSEDLPDKNNRISLTADGSGGILFSRDILHTQAHEKLVSISKNLLLDIGFNFVIPYRIGVGRSAHYCGTTVFGKNPADSVLNVFCQSHDVANLFVIDAGFFPSSSAINPALTIAAQSLRVAEFLSQSTSNIF